MQRIKNYEYNLNDKIGEGAFGQIFKCRDKYTQRIYALKIISKKKIKAQGPLLELALQREIDIQYRVSKCPFRFFVKLYDNFQDANNFYLILEYCEGGSLQKLLNKKKQLPEKIILEIVLQIGIGITYLHSINITHRDIKPDNILIKNNEMKIGDFGFANQSQQLKTCLGTWPYMSPELILQQEDLYSEKIDVWALNTLLYRLLTNKFYFSMKKLKEEVINKEFRLDNSFSFSRSEEVGKLLVLGYKKSPK